MTQYLPGTIGVSHSPGVLGRLIRTGEWLHGDGRHASRWNHAYVIVNENGDTIEAGSKGVVNNNVTEHPDRLIIGSPPGVDRAKVVEYAYSHLGVEYGYGTDVLLGFDCITRLKLHLHTDSLICSQLAALCLEFGGWALPEEASLIMPSTLVLAAAAWTDGPTR